MLQRKVKTLLRGSACHSWLAPQANTAGGVRGMQGQTQPGGTSVATGEMNSHIPSTSSRAQGPNNPALAELTHRTPHLPHLPSHPLHNPYMCPCPCVRVRDMINMPSAPQKRPPPSPPPGQRLRDRVTVEGGHSLQLPGGKDSWGTLCFAMKLPSQMPHAAFM